MAAFKIVYHLNWNLQKYTEREEMVNNLIEEGMLDGLSPHQLNEVANYLLYSEDVDAEVKLRVPSKPQVSFEEMVESGVAESAMQKQNFSIYKVPKPTIDRGKNNDGKDADIPTMKELWEAIDNIKFYYDYVRDVVKGVRERDFSIPIEPTFVMHNFFRTWYIDLCRNQYYLKDIFRPTINVVPSFSFNRHEPDSFGFKAGKYILCPHSEERMIDLGNPEHVYQLLRQYVTIKEKHFDKCDSEWTVLYDTLDKIIANMNWNPIRWDILQMKINYVSNEDVAKQIYMKHDINYSVNYISTIFRQHIARDIARRAIKEGYRWEHRNDKDAWKICSRCKKKRFNDIDSFGKNKRVCLFCTGRKTNVGKKLVVRGISED